MFSLLELSFVKRMFMHGTFFLMQFSTNHGTCSGIHAEVEGTTGKDSFSDCVSNVQPVPSAATVLVDLGKENRFGQPNQGQVLESVQHEKALAGPQNKNPFLYICLRTSWSPTRTARSVVRSGGAQCRLHTVAQFLVSCVGIPESDLYKLRLYNGISRPLAVLSGENTKLIEMQATSVAAVPSKLSWQSLLQSLLIYM